MIFGWAHYKTRNTQMHDLNGEIAAYAMGSEIAFVYSWFITKITTKRTVIFGWVRQWG